MEVQGWDDNFEECKVIKIVLELQTLPISPNRRHA
jgi:hypothetical protein